MARPRRKNVSKVSIYIDNDLLAEIERLSGLKGKTKLVELCFREYLTLLKKRKLIESYGKISLRKE